MQEKYYNNIATWEYILFGWVAMYIYTYTGSSWSNYVDSCFSCLQILCGGSSSCVHHSVVIAGSKFLAVSYAWLVTFRVTRHSFNVAMNHIAIYLQTCTFTPLSCSFRIHSIRWVSINKLGCVATIKFIWIAAILIGCEAIVDHFKTVGHLKCIARWCIHDCFVGQNGGFERTHSNYPCLWAWWNWIRC